MEMKVGDAFGESALIHDRPLQESILCMKNCHFAVLSKNKFEEILKRIEMKTRDGWKHFFKSHPLFDSLTLVSLEKLFYLVELKFFSRGQPIFKEGDEVKGFYLIYNGEVSINKIIKKKFHKKLDVGEYYKNKKNYEEDNKSLDYQSFLRSTVNTSQKIQTFSKDHELRILGEGHFIGLEDALLKRSKNTKNYFKHSCFAKSAVTSIFYFDKNK